MARVKQDAKKTLLCAVKFWGGTYPGGVFETFRTPEGHGIATSMASGARHVARKQGFSAEEIRRAERDLIREGLIEPMGRGSARITAKGRLVSCKTTKLSPWTDAGYKGAALDGARQRRKKRRR